MFLRQIPLLRHVRLQQTPLERHVPPSDPATATCPRSAPADPARATCSPVRPRYCDMFGSSTMSLIPLFHSATCSPVRQTPLERHVRLHCDMFGSPLERHVPPTRPRYCDMFGSSRPPRADRPATATCSAPTGPARAMSPATSLERPATATCSAPADPARATCSPVRPRYPLLRATCSAPHVRLQQIPLERHVPPSDSRYCDMFSSSRPR